jgi:hypothetical protein
VGQRQGSPAVIRHCSSNMRNSEIHHPSIYLSRHNRKMRIVSLEILALLFPARQSRCSVLLSFPLSSWFMSVTPNDPNQLYHIRII